jgi:hypothetical protein
VVVFLEFLQFLAQGLLLPLYCFIYLVNIYLGIAVLSFAPAFTCHYLFLDSHWFHFSLYFHCWLSLAFHFAIIIETVCHLWVSIFNWGFLFVCPLHMSFRHACRFSVGRHLGFLGRLWRRHFVISYGFLLKQVFGYSFMVSPDMRAL